MIQHRHFLWSILSILLLVGGAISLAGCGGGGDDDAAPAPVIGTLDPAILNAGGYYFQVHTQNNQGGELRTNITVPAGSTGTVTFNTTLTAAPGVTTAATGIASLTVNVSTGEVTGASITASNLSSAVTGAHIHNPAPAGQPNGAVVIDLAGRVTVN
jgi:CHRD domain-containing protein